MRLPTISRRTSPKAIIPLADARSRSTACAEIGQHLDARQERQGHRLPASRCCGRARWAPSRSRKGRRCHSVAHALTPGGGHPPWAGQLADAPDRDEFQPRRPRGAARHGGPSPSRPDARMSVQERAHACAQMVLYDLAPSGGLPAEAVAGRRQARDDPAAGREGDGGRLPPVESSRRAARPTSER